LRPALLILTALRFEAVAIAKRLGLSFSGPFLAGSGGNEGVELRVVGPRCARLSQVGVAPGCRGIIMAGLAGAVEPSLRVGDVVVDERSNLAAPEGRWRRGAIYTSGDVVATVAQKRALVAATGALVVDMENEVARAFAGGRGVPFLGIRAVSDAADDAIDPATLRWVDEAGALRPGRVVADICRNPLRIPPLLLLGVRSRLAVANLAAAVEEVARWAQGSGARPPGGAAPCGSTL
jgi:adenosylhomocysteine nucleosidase